MLDGYVQFEPYFSGNEATEWGVANEPDGIIRYEQQTFETVHSQQLGIESGWMSCTPDGYVGEDGLIEVKSPHRHYNHRENMLDPESFKKQHNDQCQFQLMLTGRKWCDLVSYDPRWKEPLDLVIVRIFPDKAWQERARNRIEQAEIIIKQTIECLIKSK